MTKAKERAVTGGVMVDPARATIKEIATALAISKSQAERKASSDSWVFMEEAVRGGRRRLYPLATLPEGVRNALAKKSLATARATTPARIATELLTISDLKTFQRDPMEARAALLAEIDRLVMTGIGRSKAVAMLIAMAARGELSPELQSLTPIANARANGSRSLSRATIYNWLKARDDAGGNMVALAPIAPPESPEPWWFRPFTKLYCIPTGPSMAEVLEHPEWPEAVAKPSYDQVRRFMKSVSLLTKSRGRVGPRAMKAMMGYKLRDASEMWPGCVFIGDGHTDKKLVAHPDSGRPFRAEITAILDVYSRKWVGWSVALAENTWAVADALRHAVTTAACCDIFYYDNGSGAKNKTWDDDCTGMAARLSITKLHSAPWSSQARGIIERFHSSVLHKLARRSITYVGARMDKEARQIIDKKIAAEIKENGSSEILPSWAEFIAELAAEQVRYNDRPHDSLDKIIDPVTGKRRHMTPNEVWDKGLEQGLTGEPISTEEARTLFRPAVRRKVTRELVSVFSNQYHARELDELHGQEVMVAYDIHDANHVEISRLDGRWLCTGKWDGHKTNYMPVPVIQQARETRLAGQLARNDDRRQNILDTAGPTLTIEHQPTIPMSLTPDQIEAAEAYAARLEAKTAPVAAAEVNPSGQRPNFGDDVSLVRWLLDHPDMITEADRLELRRKAQNRTFRMLLEMQGLDVGALSALAA